MRTEEDGKTETMSNTKYIFSRFTLERWPRNVQLGLRVIKNKWEAMRE